jgi:hypothetical protein
MATKSNAGRKKGSVSFTQVPLRALNRSLKEDAVVTVSRKFAEVLNLTGNLCSHDEQLKSTEAEELLEDSPPVEVKVNENW